MKKDPFLFQENVVQRLLDDYFKHGSLIIGYDFDNTVYDYHGKGYTFDLVITLLHKLKAVNCVLICWTANPDIDFVKKYLADNNIPCDGVNENSIDLGWKTDKPFFNMLLDDRAGLQSAFNALVNFLNNLHNNDIQIPTGNTEK